MSREIDHLRHIFNERLAQAGSSSFYGVIEDVDEEKRTCRVWIGEVLYDGVLLYAIEQPELKGWVMVPPPQSGVIVSRIESSHRMYVEMFSVVEKILLTFGDQTLLRLDIEGAEMHVQNTALKLDPAGCALSVEDNSCVTTDKEGTVIRAPNLVLEATSSGFLVERNGESLLGLLDELCTQLTLLTVTTGVGPSGVPINAGQISSIQTRLKTLKD